MPRLTFHPTPDQIAALVGNLASPDLCLRDIAARHNTTLDALTLYLTSDRSLEHIATLELAAAVRTRLAASAHLNRAVAALSDMLDDYIHARAQTSAQAGTQAAAQARASSALPAAPSAPAAPAPSSPPASLILQERQRQNARRACYLLFRLATYTPRPLAGVAAPAAHHPSAPGASASPPAPSPSAPAFAPARVPAQPETPTTPSRGTIAPASTHREPTPAPSPVPTSTARVARASPQSLSAYTPARPRPPAPKPTLCETG